VIGNIVIYRCDALGSFVYSKGDEVLLPTRVERMQGLNLCTTALGY
jgi:hypothetical protein